MARWKRRARGVGVRGGTAAAGREAEVLAGGAGAGAVVRASYAR